MREGGGGGGGGGWGGSFVANVIFSYIYIKVQTLNFIYPMYVRLAC